MDTIHCVRYRSNPILVRYSYCWILPLYSGSQLRYIPGNITIILIILFRAVLAIEVGLLRFEAYIEGLQHGRDLQTVSGDSTNQLTLSSMIADLIIWLGIHSHEMGFWLIALISGGLTRIFPPSLGRILLSLVVRSATTARFFADLWLYLVRLSCQCYYWEQWRILSP